jgi:F0F1-type ATP synthase membrane subunit c/vacuolar-type H+-ATPase subunit K
MAFYLAYRIYEIIVIFNNSNDCWHGSNCCRVFIIGAGVAFGLAALGAGIAIGGVGAAGLAAITERPELRSQALVFTALGEAIAIYGIVVAIIILGQS